MKPVASIVICLFLRLYTFAQSTENTVALIEQQLELQAEKVESYEGDALLEQLSYFIKHPLNLNEADADDLKELIVLSDLQINSFLQYRHVLGSLISIYELQAVPEWNTSVISGLLPFVTVGESAGILQSIAKQCTAGTHSLLFRTAGQLEKPAGYTVPHGSGSYYTGSPVSLYFRYAYHYTNTLQWGILGQKDAGEQFFRGTQKGFDFSSFHFFVRKHGIIKSLAIGDFTVNMGQGLMQWQSFGFKKSAEITSVKRQSAVLQPYSASGEYNFFRGIGVTLRKGKWEGTGFISSRKISGNAVTDTSDHSNHISSLLTSGYHRTYNELEDKNNLRQQAAGGSIKYEAGNWHVAANLIGLHFSTPIVKETAPYNLFAMKGSSFINTGLDYSFTYKNMLLFGEAATDQNRHPAVLQGLILSADPKVDISLLYRSISKSYQALYANAFTENTAAANEKGLFAGITIRPGAAFTINAYTDVFYFPWLTFSARAPSYGREYFIQLTYAPGRRVQVYTHFRNQQQEADRADAGPAGRVPGLVPRQNWRMQCNMAVSPAITFKNRFEIVWYDATGSKHQEGFLAFAEAGYKPPLKDLSANARLMYFETQGYDSRLYAFENDVQYVSSLPAFYDKGVRYYLNFNYNATRFARKFIAPRLHAECWARIARTFYPEKELIGSGLDQVSGNKKTEITFQLMLSM